MTAGELAALESGLIRLGLFFRMTTDPIIRLWLGVGKIEPGVNTLDSTGAVYTGFGELRSLAEFSQLVNGQAERVDFTMSGVSGELLGLAGQSQDKINGKEVAIGFGLMNETWALIGPIRWSRVFYADFLAINQAQSETDTVRTLTLSCGSLMTARRRPGLSYYSDPDQQGRSAGDRFCERVPKYAQDVQKPWPRF
jgi:hypothetical protein